MPAPQLPRLTTAQVAARLGVKPETVYAYVSRGLLSREAAFTRGAGGAGGKASTFDPIEVESLAARTARRRSSERSGSPRAAGVGGSPLMVIDSALTLIDGDELFYRGVPAVRLAATTSYEDAAFWLWTGRRDGPAAFEPAAMPARGPLSSAAWRRSLGLIDRLRVAVAVASSANPLRHDLDEPSVLRAATELIATMVTALPDRPRQPGPVGGASIARRLWTALTGDEPGDAAAHAIDTALVLLADHDLATSTLAARVAASARAHPYSVVAAGMGPLDGLLHGAASLGAHRMLVGCLSAGRSPVQVVTEALHDTGRLPAFGHALYQQRDPRAQALLGALAEVDALRPALDVAAEVIDVVAGRSGLFPNVDLALAVLTAGAGMRPDAGEAIFAVARAAGWIAHAIEEYGCAPLRLRPVGRYVGLAPDVVAERESRPREGESTRRQIP